MDRPSTVDAMIEKHMEAAPQIFKNRDALSIHYVPDELPHRENHLEKMVSILVTALKGGMPSNVFIYGKTGTGKTAAAKLVLRSLVSKGREKSIPLINAYINCNQINTNYRVLARLCEEIGINVPFTGLPTDEVYSRFREGLDTTEQLLILILDEVDKLVNRSGNDVLYDLTRMKVDLNKAGVSLIGITNDLKFKEQLDPRVLSSLSEEELFFAPYKAIELQRILNERAKRAFHPGVLDYGVINLCAAIAAREHGDARRALDLLRVSGEFAERQKLSKVTEELVKKARKRIEQATVEKFLKTLPIQSKTVLHCIYLLEANGKKEIFSGDVYDVYSEICGIVGLDRLTQRRVSDFINELIMHGIIAAQEISRGRYGRTRRIQLSVNPDQIKSVLEDEDKTGRFKQLIDFVPTLLRP
ncbi:MAG: ORC1-type DNA replication protein [Candidatus Sifarchaeia archaeon]|jgi:cell division control protein 6